MSGTAVRSLLAAATRTIITDASTYSCSFSSSSSSTLQTARQGLRQFASSSEAAVGSGASEASTSTSALGSSGLSTGWLYRTVKQKGNVSYAELIETKRKAWYLKLTFWEKFYYAAGVIGASLYIYSKVDWDGRKAAAAEAQRKKDEEQRAKRLEILPLYLTGSKNFADEDESLFEGASPAEINELEEAYWESKGGRQKASNKWNMPAFSDADDPYEGLSPEEIDALVNKGS